MVWCGTVWHGVAWRGVAWRGVAWRGAAWCGVAWLMTIHLPLTCASMDDSPLAGAHAASPSLPLPPLLLRKQ